MLLSTQAGIVVNSDHVAWIALRREVPSPSEPDPPPGSGPTYRVLLGMAAQVDGTYIVAARSLSLEEARFVREDIAYHWSEGTSRWSACASLEAHREGAYFAEDSPESQSSNSGTNQIPRVGTQCVGSDSEVAAAAVMPRRFASRPTESEVERRDGK